MSSDIKEIKINWERIGKALMFLPKLATRPLAKLERKLGVLCGAEAPYVSLTDDKSKLSFLKVPAGIAASKIYDCFPSGKKPFGALNECRFGGMAIGTICGLVAGVGLAAEAVLAVPAAAAVGLTMPFVGAAVVPYLAATLGTIFGGLISLPSVLINIPTGIARTREAWKKPLPTPTPIPTAQSVAQPAQPFSHMPAPLTKEQMLGMHVSQIALEMQPLTPEEKQQALLKLAERFPDAFNAAADAIIQKRVQASLAAAEEAPVRLAEPLRMRKKKGSAAPA